MDRHTATRRLLNLARASGVRIGRTHPYVLRHAFVTTMLERRGGPARRADRRPARRSADRDAPERAPNNLDRHPNYILAA
jgi:integrase